MDSTSNSSNKRKMGGRRNPEAWRKKATSGRWNSNWSHGRPLHFPKEKREMNWEKEYCKSNGVGWERLLEAKRLLNLIPMYYSKIVDWDDSAGKEAFESAKARYWAHINGIDQPENNPLPDPYMFIDSIDPDETPSNPDLLTDSSDGDCWGEGGVILWDSRYSNNVEEDAFSTGWGVSHQIIPTGWGDIPAESSVQVQHPVSARAGADCLNLKWGVEPTCSWADIPQITSTKIVATGWVA